MSLDSQLQRTVGTVYGEIMRDSVTLADGRYIVARHFISALSRGGVRIAPSRHEMLINMIYCIGYGSRDNILTGIQFIGGWGDSPHNLYTFNRWRELMGGSSLRDITHYFDISPKVAEALRRVQFNPREGVIALRDIYALFTKLPRTLQEEFLGLVENFPCDLHLAVAPQVHFDYLAADPLRRTAQDIVSRIVQATSEEYQHDIKYVLQLIAQHNLCVGKGELIKRQIEDLLGYDVSTIPKRWEEGNIKPTAVAEKREELNRLLHKQ